MSYKWDDSDWFILIVVLLFVGSVIAIAIATDAYAVGVMNDATEAVTEPTEVAEVREIVEPPVKDLDTILSSKETAIDIPDTTSVEEETTPEPSEEDVEMLACVIYQEAGSDWICDDCRRRVADVVLNRVNSDRFPDTIYEVLTQSGQYGEFAWTGVVWPARASYSSETHAVERAYQIAREVLMGQHSDLYDNGYIWQAAFTQGVDNVYCCGHYYGR